MQIRLSRQSCLFGQGVGTLIFNTNGGDGGCQISGVGSFSHTKREVFSGTKIGLI